MRFEFLITPALVKAEAARRIEERFPLWRQVNALRSGEALEMGGYIDQVRAASNALEGLTPIPLDYLDDRHWPEKT